MDDNGSQLPARNREFIEKLCAERGLKVPRIGIIQSGTPNAFSFGRLRSDASVVVTSGLLEVLGTEKPTPFSLTRLATLSTWIFS